VVKVAFNDDAANTTTVPDRLAEAGAGDTGAEVVDAAGAADDTADDAAALDAAADVAAVLAAATTGELAADDVDAAVFFDELQPARASATTTVVTRTAGAWRFIDSPRSGRGRRLIGVRW
jgi:hypothetical protein